MQRLHSKSVPDDGLDLDPEVLLDRNLPRTPRRIASHADPQRLQRWTSGQSVDARATKQMLLVVVPSLKPKLTTLGDVGSSHVLSRCYHATPLRDGGRGSTTMARRGMLVRDP